MIKKIYFMLIIFMVCIQYIQPETVRISQIDTSDLLLNQDVKLYISVLDNNGVPKQNLTKEMFTVFESPDGKNFTKIDEITNFSIKENYEKGVNFLLLVDNSGSMYFDMKGRPTSNENNMRITHAKNAIRSFLDSVTNPNDTIGIASYNSYFTLYSEPINNRAKINEYLDSITKPSGEEAWTEIYSSLCLAIKEFEAVKGRKAIIILSDGENMPYYTNVHKEHRQFGSKVYTYDEPILDAQKEGISIFAINFGEMGERKDKNLKSIANQTGGMVFDADNQAKLSNVYKTINEQILNEYLLTYKATMNPTDKKFVKVNFNYNNRDYDTTRFYFSSTIFGMPLKEFNPLILLAFLAACLLLLLLSLIKFKNTSQNATIEMLSTQVGKAVTQIVTLNEGKTIIGSSNNANMTIVGNTDIKDNHATIQYDKNRDKYTIVADGDMTVNNKSVSTKVLEPGDLINVGGATIVFDDAVIKNMKNKKKKK